MSSRTALMLGLSGLAVIVGGIVWFTRVQATGTTTTTTAASSKSEAAPSVVRDNHELTAPGGNSGTHAAVPGGQPGVGQGRPSADRKSVEQPPAQPPRVAGATAVESVGHELSTPDAEPLKLGTLSPILGGETAIKGKYLGSTYAERRERADTLEAAFNTLDPNTPLDPDTYQALKNELIWLRDNMGTPPAEIPK